MNEWSGSKHPEHDGLLELYSRVGQVWEDEDGWIYFIVGEPTVVTYEVDGRPFQYEHEVFVIDAEGDRVEWNLFETNDRPLEVSDLITRLA